MSDPTSGSLSSRVGSEGDISWTVGYYGQRRSKHEVTGLGHVFWLVTEVPVSEFWSNWNFHLSPSLLWISGLKGSCFPEQARDRLVKVSYVPQRYSLSCPKFLSSNSPSDSFLRRGRLRFGGKSVPVLFPVTGTRFVVRRDLPPLSGERTLLRWLVRRERNLRPDGLPLWRSPPVGSNRLGLYMVLFDRVHSLQSRFLDPSSWLNPWRNGNLRTHL